MQKPEPVKGIRATRRAYCMTQCVDLFRQGLSVRQVALRLNMCKHRAARFLEEAGELTPSARSLSAALPADQAETYRIYRVKKYSAIEAFRAIGRHDLADAARQFRYGG